MHLFLAAASGKFTGRLFKKTFKIFREHELHPGRSHLEMFQLDHLMGHHWLRAANKHSVIRTISIHKQCHECGEHWPVSRNCALGQELLCVSLRSQCGQAAHKIYTLHAEIFGLSDRFESCCSEFFSWKLKTFPATASRLR